MTGRREWYLALVSAAGVAVIAAAAAALLRHPPPALWFALLAATALAAWFPVRMPGFPVSLSLAETFTFIAVLLVGLAAGVVAVAVDGAVISLRLTRDRRHLTRFLFNAAAPALAMWAAGRLVAIGPVDPTVVEVGGASFVARLAAFAAVYFVLNSVLVAIAVPRVDGDSWFRIWRRHLAPLWVSPCVGALLADVVTVIAIRPEALATTLLLVFPVGIALIFAFSRVLEHLQRRSAAFMELRTFAAALRSTEDAVIICDPAGRITFMNPAAERMTGWTHADTVGRQLDDVRVLQLETSADEEAADRLVSEHRLVRRDGGVVDIEETHTAIVDEDGSAVGTITTFRDIGARKALERSRAAVLAQEQEARRLADEANRTKDEFLSTLSHELRTPTTAIVGWAQLLKSGRLDSERTTRAIEALERNARAQAVVLNDLVDVSRIVRGMMTLERRRTDLSVVIREALDTVEPARDAKDIALDLQLDADLPVIDADPNRLRQVMWNVLSNAVKFTPAGGWLRVSARRDGGSLRIEVADSGDGIDPAFLPFVFDRFRQGDQSSTRHHGGLGLGLALVRYVVEAHGGAAVVESAGPGRGTTVIITLPATLRRREGDAAT
jgi:PAS domain S-box-containing protein